MSIVQPPPLPPRSGTRRFWTAFGVLTGLVVVLVALIYAEENGRGARDWNAVQNDLHSRGENLDWHDYAAPRVPDERNLAMAPFFVRELHYEADSKTHTYTFGPSTHWPRDLDEMPYGADRRDHVKGGASYELARLPDLTAHQSYFRLRKAFPHPEQPGTPAADVLVALTRYGPALDEFARAADERPLTCFPLDWNRKEFWGLQFPHYLLAQNLVRTLSLRASARLATGDSARLATGDSAGALRDLELGLRLCRDLTLDHIVIGHLVELTCLAMVENEVWDGLATRRWTAEELARLQRDLQAFDLLADFAGSIRMERAMTIHNVDFLRRTHDPGILFITGYSGDTLEARAKRALGWLIPAGWYDANKALFSRFVQDYSLGSVDVGAHRVLPDRTHAGERVLETIHKTPRLVLAETMLPITVSFVARPVRGQTTLDQAITACALERFYRDHQAYPARLDELVPVYLERVPTDVIDGAPLRYRLTSDGRYQLYAVGWDGKDDGGRVEWATSGRLDDKKGDLVWQYTELVNPKKRK